MARFKNTRRCHPPGDGYTSGQGRKTAMTGGASLSGGGHDPANRNLPPSVIGLTGPNAAGKGEAAAYLVRRGYAYHSLSDIVREEAAARGLSHSREDLIRVGNDLRIAGGPGAL